MQVALGVARSLVAAKGMLPRVSCKAPDVIRIAGKVDSSLARGDYAPGALYQLAQNALGGHETFLRGAVHESLSREERRAHSPSNYHVVFERDPRSFTLRDEGAPLAAHMSSLQGDQATAHRGYWWADAFECHRPCPCRCMDRVRIVQLADDERSKVREERDESPVILFGNEQQCMYRT